MRNFFNKQIYGTTSKYFDTTLSIQQRFYNIHLIPEVFKTRFEDKGISCGQGSEKETIILRNVFLSKPLWMRLSEKKINNGTLSESANIAVYAFLRTWGRLSRLGIGWKIYNEGNLLLEL